MTLARSQQAFCAEIAATDEAAPPSTPGMAIYQNAYRARLLAALETSYECTRRWVGEAAFTAAACHYVIAQPPRDWTLDRYGAQFPQVLAELFAADPEVAELAWLEWQMQQTFAAPDLPELTARGLTEARLDEADWESVRLTMAAGFAARPITQDVAGLWQTLQSDEPAKFTLQSDAPGVLAVWRKGLSPHYRVFPGDEFAALDCLVRGATFGDAANLAGDPARFGGWFAAWLSEGLFAALDPPLNHAA